MAQAFTGGCLCGAVRYSCAGEPMMAGHCHCEDCRRSSGTGHCSHLVVPEAALRMTGETRAYERPANSGHIITRCFCPTCGAPILSLNSAMPGTVALRASSLDDLEVFKPQMHVYVGRAASWDRPGDGLPVFETMPPGMG
ncbi:MAG: GFA family protein [Thermoanaerobaculia bacterium]|nr:GFA family protein [Thermoanaerobaculia bacterium]